MSNDRERALCALLFLNISLQIFDGVATWLGVRAGYPEGNPFVAYAIDALGPTAGLWFVKAQACGWLALVWALRRRSVLAAPALAIAATIYLALSVGPWSAVLGPVYLASS